MSLKYRQVRFLTCDDCSTTFEPSSNVADAIDVRVESRKAGWSAGKRKARNGGRALAADYCGTCTTRRDATNGGGRS